VLVTMMLNVYRKHYWLAWVLLPLVIGYIYYISSIPADPIPRISFAYKAVAYHFGIFFVLAFLSIIAFSRGGKEREFVVVAILFSMLYAVTDEVHQLLVFARSADPLDFVTDAVGIFVAMGVYFISE
jgi:hypothetical protein